MFNKLKDLFKKTKPVWNESIGEVNITQLPTYDIVSSPGWSIYPSNRINKIKRILEKI
jgi:hypothetical protein